MRLRLIVAAALTTVLAAPTALITTTAPAHAATATKIVGGTSGKPWIYRSSSSSNQPGAMVYGDTISLSINVVAGSDQVYDGSLTVQRKLPGGSWKTVKTSSSAYLYDSMKAVGNAAYRVLYSGTADYAPSSAGAKAKVQRKVTVRNVGQRRVVLDGNAPFRCTMQMSRSGCRHVERNHAAQDFGRRQKLLQDRCVAHPILKAEDANAGA